MQYLLRTWLIFKLEHQKEHETTSRDPLRNTLGSGRHVQVHFHLLVRIQGIQRRGDPASEGVRGEVGVPRNLFPRLGVG